MSLNELVGVWVRPEQVARLHACVLESARTDEQRGEYGPVYRVCHDRVLGVVLRRVADQVLDDFYETFVEQR